MVAQVDQLAERLAMARADVAGLQGRKADKAAVAEAQQKLHGELEV